MSLAGLRVEAGEPDLGGMAHVGGEGRVVGAADEGDNAAVGGGNLAIFESRGVEGVGDDVVAVGPVRSRESAEIITYEVQKRRNQVSAR
jgi:hypothetical protein